MKCEHKNFAASVDVNRLTETDGGRVTGYSADVRIQCVECQEPFRFIGLPCGVDPTGACVNIDGTEGRFAILPKSMSLSELEGTPIGFTCRKSD